MSRAVRGIRLERHRGSTEFPMLALRGNVLDHGIDHRVHDGSATGRFGIRVGGRERADCAGGEALHRPDIATLEGHFRHTEIINDRGREPVAIPGEACE